MLLAPFVKWLFIVSNFPFESKMVNLMSIVLFIKASNLFPYLIICKRRN